MSEERRRPVLAIVLLMVFPLELVGTLATSPVTPRVRLGVSSAEQQPSGVGESSLYPGSSRSF